MTLRKKLLLIGSIACLAGAVGVAPALYYRHRDRVLAQNAAAAPTVVAPVVVSKDVITGKPVTLHILSLNMNLSIADGVSNPRTGEWTLSNDKVHYALVTPQPNNEAGNTFIYGHYRPEVFSRLHNIKPGAEVSIETDNGYRFVYVYRSNRVTDPSDGSIFTYQGPPILTLQTCTGRWMENRQLFTFDFVRYEKI